MVRSLESGEEFGEGFNSRVFRESDKFVRIFVTKICVDESKEDERVE